jgi:hypothetical protein
MVRSLVSAPLAFFHTTPAGRILNRLTKDQGIADDYLPSVAFDSLQSVLMSIGEKRDITFFPLKKSFEKKERKKTHSFFPPPFSQPKMNNQAPSPCSSSPCPLSPPS